MKTKLQMIEEIKASGAKFISYGESDLGVVIVPVDEALADIAAMDDEMIGNGDWMEHDSIEPAVIVGTLHTARNGYWFELADESAGAEANTFASREAAEKAMADLGWECDIYTLSEIKSLGCEI